MACRDFMIAEVLDQWLQTARIFSQTPDGLCGLCSGALSNADRPVALNARTCTFLNELPQAVQLNGNGGEP